MEVFKLLMEIVKETSSIVRNDDQLLGLLQTTVKREVGIEDDTQEKSVGKNMMQLVDDNKGIEKLQNTLSMEDDFEEPSNENPKNEKPSGFTKQIQEALAVFKEKINDDMTSKTKFDFSKAEQMLNALSSFRSTEIAKDRRKRESNADITPEMIAYALDKYLQENQSKETNCLIQILWNKDGKYEGTLCSKVSQDLGKKVRKLLFMILKKELPSSLFFLDYENIMKEFMSRGQKLETHAKTIAIKFLQPITGENLKEILTPIVEVFKKPIFGNEKIDLIFNGILRFIIKMDNLNKLSVIVRQVQKEIILR